MELSETNLTPPPRVAGAHTPAFTHSYSPCLFSREAVKSQLLPSWCVFYQSSFTHSIFFNKHTERLSSKPSTPTPPFPRSESLNIFKENKWFLHDCTEQHCVTAFLAYAWWMFVFLDLWSLTLMSMRLLLCNVSQGNTIFKTPSLCWASDLLLL